MRRLLPLLFLCAGACGPATRDCPAPVGRIVLEDCEIYARRYEAVRTQVSPVLGGEALHQGAPQAAHTQDAFELLAHRLQGLCQDHNACRLGRADHAKARAELDDTFSQLTALSERWRASDDPAERASLQAQVRRLLMPDAQAAPPAPRAAYMSWLPWLDAALLPKRRPGVHLVGHEYDVERARAAERSQWRGRLRVDLYDPADRFAADDALVLTWPGEHVVEVPLGRRGNGPGHVSRTAKAPEATASTARTIGPVQVALRRGATGQVEPVGTVGPARVLTHPGKADNPKDDRWGVDRDPLVDRGWLAFHPTDRALPAIHGERPWLSVVLRVRDHVRATLRCAVNGEDVFGALPAGRFSGQVDTFQDRPRYRSAGPGRSVGVKHPHVEWWRLSFPLPFVLGAEPTGGDRPWPLEGSWQCRVVVDGHPVRRVGFRVGADGRPVGLAPQGARWWLPTQSPKTPVETTVEVTP